MSKSGFVIYTIVLVLVSITLAAAIYTPTSTELLAVPRIRVKEGTSTNWSGYAVETSLTSPQKGAVTDVIGSWNVPAVTGTTTAYSSFWIGIDGYSSGTVEQIGTDSDISSGKAIYYAWYEMYPKWPVNLSTIAYQVSPGDTISAEVKYQGSKFILTITDFGKWTYSTTQKSGSAKRSSAEWVAEAPWSGGVLPLADFGSVTFNECTTTLNGHTGSISDNLWKYDAIDMTTSSGAMKADTLSLLTNGSSFSVQFVSSGP